MLLYFWDRYILLYTLPHHLVTLDHVPECSKPDNAISMLSWYYLYAVLIVLYSNTIFLIICLKGCIMRTTIFSNINDFLYNECISKLLLQWPKYSNFGISSFPFDIVAKHDAFSNHLKTSAFNKRIRRNAFFITENCVCVTTTELENVKKTA